MSSLFVSEETPERMVESSEYDSNGEMEYESAASSAKNSVEPSIDYDNNDDDPIIEEIPIHLNFDSLVNNSEIDVFQYPTRTISSYAGSNNSQSILKSRIKDNSGVIELEIPMNTTKFFDDSKSNKWLQTKTQTLRGVFNENSGYYVGIVKDKQLYLNKVTKTSQLRPSFKYIDDAKNIRIQNERELNSRTINDDADKKKEAANGGKNGAHVVQMAVKSSGENIPRLGGALQSCKLEEGEFFVDYKWNNGDSESSKNLRNELINEEDEVLISKDSQNKYFDDLLADGTVTPFNA